MQKYHKIVHLCSILNGFTDVEAVFKPSQDAVKAFDIRVQWKGYDIIDYIIRNSAFGLMIHEIEILINRLKENQEPTPLRIDVAYSWSNGKYGEKD